MGRRFTVYQSCTLDEVRDAALLANPGCYPTAIILAAYARIRAGYVDVEHGIICDAKSGVSGAGKTPTAKTHFVEVDGDFSAYSVFGHRHTGEMLEQLGLNSQFSPVHATPAANSTRHSLTIYVKLAMHVTTKQLEQSLQEFYAEKPWVRVFGSARLPQIKFSTQHELL